MTWRWAYIAPLIFVVHVVEEAPTFVVWFNRHVEPDITTPLFLSVNLFALLITTAVAVALARSDESLVAGVALAWFGFLFLANGAFHVVATVVDREYCPGTVSGLLLYLPYFALVFARAVRGGGLPVAGAAVITAAGAAPMLVHGYLIVFRGGRLF